MQQVPLRHVSTHLQLTRRACWTGCGASRKILRLSLMAEDVQQVLEARQWEATVFLSPFCDRGRAEGFPRGSEAEVPKPAARFRQG